MNIDNFINTITSINEPTELFKICCLFMFLDIVSGYIKSWEDNTMDSSVSRDGYLKKCGFILALVGGYLIDVFIGTSVFLFLSAMTCIVTEGLSFYENLSEIGLTLPFSKHFKKLETLIKGDEK